MPAVCQYQYDLQLQVEVAFDANFSIYVKVRYYNYDRGRCADQEMICL